MSRSACQEAQNTIRRPAGFFSRKISSRSLSKLNIYYRTPERVPLTRLTGQIDNASFTWLEVPIYVEFNLRKFGLFEKVVSLFGTKKLSPLFGNIYVILLNSAWFVYTVIMETINHFSTEYSEDKFGGTCDPRWFWISKIYYSYFEFLCR